MTELKTALVTGANKGIGYEVVRRLAKDGFTVWLGARDKPRGEAAATALTREGLDVRLLQIDVADEASVVKAARDLRGQTDRLDVLINNAGIVADLHTPPSEETVASIKAVYEVNVFGPVRVTQAFLPLLKTSSAPRIVMVSSGLASLTRLADPASEFYGINLLSYNSSKTALNAITLAFAKELAATGFKVNAADPGYTATDLNGNTGYRTVEQAAEVIIRLATLPADGPNAGFFDDQGPEAW
ncbi:MAG: SDR family oxidoreductase [Methylovirgula sp.]|uniref:SDR family oxidoreductase n=1 Tax=Methylovirgula sp. TaxID=1978224 RepID=UPI00307642C6